MWQTKDTLVVPKNLGVEVNFQLCSEGYFLSGRPSFIVVTMGPLGTVLSGQAKAR